MKSCHWTLVCFFYFITSVGGINMHPTTCPISIADTFIQEIVRFGFTNCPVYTHYVLEMKRSKNNGSELGITKIVVLICSVIAALIALLSFIRSYIKEQIRKEQILLEIKLAKFINKKVSMNLKQTR